jgi:hypothetical protein
VNKPPEITALTRGNMNSKSYVVRLLGSEEHSPFKHFASLEDAVAYAHSYVDGELRSRGVS